MGRAGYDWVCIDTQHGLSGYDQMLPMLQALSATGTPAFVRVPWNQPSDIMKALDAGAEGVVVPMVNSQEEARRAVGACRYPPQGFRSWGPTRAALQVTGFGPESANRAVRSEEHTSELQSPCNLVCRLLLEKKKLGRQIRSHIHPNPYGVSLHPR